MDKRGAFPLMVDVGQKIFYIPYKLWSSTLQGGKSFPSCCHYPNITLSSHIRSSFYRFSAFF
jgi:hypothetical protein